MAMADGDRTTDDSEEYVTVSYDEDEELPDEPSLEYDEQADNLVSYFKATDEGEEFLKDIASERLEEFQQDWDSLDKWRQKCAAIVRRYVCELPKRDNEDQNVAQATMPITLETLSRLSARIASELFGDWKQFFAAVPSNTGDESENEAVILTQHGNYQFRNEIPDFQRQAEKLITWGVLCGSMIGYSYYNVERQQNHHKTISPDNFVFPYTNETTQPDLSDLPRYAWIRRLYAHELELLRDEEGWEYVDKVLGEATESDDGLETPVLDAMSEKLGHDKNEMAKLTDDETGEGGTYTIIHWEGWLRLPNQDRRRWCQVIIHKSSECVLSLKIHEEPDWRDKERFNLQADEAAAYEAAKSSYDEQVEAVTGQVEMSGMASVEAERNDRFVPDAENAFAAAQQAVLSLPPEPLPPSWMRGGKTKPRRVRQKPICMFYHGVMMENLVGALGLGMGHITVEYDKPANVLLAQYIDAMTLANTKTIVTTKNVKFEGGLGLRPGKHNTVTGVSNTDLNNAIKVLEFGEANGQMGDLIGKLHSLAQGAVSSPDVLAGAAGKSGETRGGLTARIEQATKQLGSMARRAATVFKQIILNNARLNSMFLDDTAMFMVMDDKLGRWDRKTITKRAYERSYSVELASDMKFTSDEQKIRDADEVAMMVLKTPQLQSNAALAYEVIKDSFTARGKYKLVALMGARPPPPPVFLGLPQAPPAGSPPPSPPPG